MNDKKVKWCKCGNRVYEGQECAICVILESVDKQTRKEDNDSNTDAG